jgi:ABC-type glycerol-3-phosphate transport system substrate-binding protein
MKKNQMVRKVLCVVLAFGMALSMMGCNKGEGNEEAIDKNDTTETGVDLPEETGTPNEWGWVVPEETLEFTVYAGTGDQETFIADEKGGKKAMDEWLLENMNVKINVEYYNNDMVEKLNLMLAGGDYPDVITWMSDDMANKFIAQGKAVDLTPYIDQYGGNITRRLGNYINMIKNEDGTISKLPQYWGENPNVAGKDFGVRYDLWKELGETDIYTTPDEYFDVMQKILKNHPTNANGQTTYAFTSDNQGMNFLDAMLASYGFIYNFKVDENGEFTHWLNSEEGLEIAKFVNKCYLADMIDPDYMSNLYEQVMTKMNSEQVLANFGTWWFAWTGGHEYWQVQDGENYNIDKRFMNVSVSGTNVALDQTTLLTTNYIGSYRAIITDKCKNVEGVVKFLDWQNSELGNFICSWGIPSEENVWKIADDGTWVFDEEILNPDQYAKQEYFHDVRDAHSCMAYSIATNMNWLKTDGRSNFDMIDKKATRVSAYDFWPVDDSGNFASEGIKKCWQYYTAPAKDITLNVVTYDPEAEITITKQTIEDTIKTEWNKMITAKSPEECEEIFMKARETCNTIGLEDLTEFNQQAYQSNLTKYQGE